MATNYRDEDFITLYPGVYTEREKEAVKKYINELKAINDRGKIDIQDLISGKLPADTPGIGPIIEVTEEMVRYCNGKYEQENPLFNDAEYAKAAGFQDILAYFTFGANDDVFTNPYPTDVRDTLCVSQLSHSISALEPIYPGDTLYVVKDYRSIIDLTPEEGDIYRTLALHEEGSIYNQKGKKVNAVEFNLTESIRIFKEGKRPENMGFADVWDSPDWNRRPAHYYTDEDYEYIKSIWRAEKLRGNKPLYWDDVSIGERPPITAEGPIIESVLPTAPYGQGIGGTRTMKKEILNEEIFAQMIKRPSDGIYILKDKKAYTPPIPEGVEVVMMIDDGRDVDEDKKDSAIDTKDIHSSKKDERAGIINFWGRDVAIRHLHDWIGDYGKIRRIRWSIMPQETHAVYGKTVPRNPYFRHFLAKVPELKDRICNSHGLTGDLALVNSCVVDKYIKNGKHMVELVWWIEDIEQNIWIEGDSVIELPSKTESLFA